MLSLLNSSNTIWQVKFHSNTAQIFRSKKIIIFGEGIVNYGKSKVPRWFLLILQFSFFVKDCNTGGRGGTCRARGWTSAGPSRSPPPWCRR